MRVFVTGSYDLTIDGVWGRGSQKSINLFRRKNNIPLSSEWDQKTQDALTQLSGSKIE